MAPNVTDAAFERVEEVAPLPPLSPAEKELLSRPRPSPAVRTALARPLGPSATLARRHAAEDAALAVWDPGFYDSSTHDLRARMRREKTIEDWDWEIALLRQNIDRNNKAIAEISGVGEYVAEHHDDEARMRAVWALPDDPAEAGEIVRGWLTQLRRGREHLERELTRRIEVLAQIVDKRSLKQQRERYLVEGEVIFAWAEGVDAIFAELIERAMRQMQALAPGANPIINNWAATMFEELGAKLEKLPMELAKKRGAGAPGGNGNGASVVGERRGAADGGADAADDEHG